MKFFRRLFLEMIGKNWSRGGEKFGGDTGEDDTAINQNAIIIFFFF